MPEKSPGQVCYEAFDAAYPADRWVRLTWHEQAPAVQRAWEAAAQAVRAAYKNAMADAWREGERRRRENVYPFLEDMPHA